MPCHLGCLQPCLMLQATLCSGCHTVMSSHISSKMSDDSCHLLQWQGFVVLFHHIPPFQLSTVMHCPFVFFSCVSSYMSSSILSTLPIISQPPWHDHMALFHIIQPYQSALAMSTSYSHILLLIYVCSVVQHHTHIFISEVKGNNMGIPLAQHRCQILWFQACIWKEQVL